MALKPASNMVEELNSTENPRSFPVPGIQVDGHAIYNVQRVGSAAKEDVRTAEKFGRYANSQTGNFPNQAVNVIWFAGFDQWIRHLSNVLKYPLLSR